MLRDKVKEYGLKRKWREIAAFLPGRVGKQCRERWYNKLDPSLNRRPWTLEEDLQLFDLLKEHGSKWAKMQ
jgi:hypothetical protein